MPSALPVDLRERIVTAVEKGASRRLAAKRLGLYESFAQERPIAPKPMIGDQRSQSIEA